MPTFIATDLAGYEKYVGRRSQPLAPAVVEFAGVKPGERVLDVGLWHSDLMAALGDANIADRYGDRCVITSGDLVEQPPLGRKRTLLSVS